MIKLLKYTLNEVVQNKLKVIFTFSIFVVAIISLYLLFEVLLQNYESTNVPSALNDDEIVAMMHLPPVENVQTPPEKYQEFFEKLKSLEKDYDSFQFAQVSFIGTEDVRLSTGDNFGFNNSQVQLYAIDGLIVSASVLETQQIGIEFIKGESLASFSGNKVILPAKYRDNYQLGENITFYNPYYNQESSKQLVEPHQYTIVGFTNQGEEIYNLSTLAYQNLNSTLLFGEIDVLDISYHNIEYDAIVSTLISNIFYSVPGEELPTLTYDITQIAKEFDLSINLVSNTRAVKISGLAYLQILKNNLVISIPTILLFIIALKYAVAQILQTRLKFLSIISILGANESFLKSIYITLVMIINSLAWLLSKVILELYHTSINDKILALSTLATFVVALIVILFVLRIIKTENLGRLVREGND